MLINSTLEGLEEKDVLSNLSFLSNQTNTSTCLKRFEGEFKEILGSIINIEDNTFATLSNSFTKQELELYLNIYEELTKTKPVQEENLLNTIYTNGIEEEIISLLRRPNPDNRE